MDNVVLVGAIAGANELIKRLRAKDYWAAATIFTSGLIGFLLGLFMVVEFQVTGSTNNAVSGLITGLAVSGAFSFAGSVAGGNAAVANRLSVFKK